MDISGPFIFLIHWLYYYRFITEFCRLYVYRNDARTPVLLLTTVSSRFSLLIHIFLFDNSPRAYSLAWHSHIYQNLWQLITHFFDWKCIIKTLELRCKTLFFAAIHQKSKCLYRIPFTIHFRNRPAKCTKL